MVQDSNNISEAEEEPVLIESNQILNKRVTGNTSLVGLIGWPVNHSLSPQMHNAAFNALELDFVYVPLAVQPDSLGQAMQGVAALGFRGVNVTVPHKQAVMAYLDEIHPAAQAIGAVNTIRFDQPDNSEKEPTANTVMLRGYNTDWSGFQADLDSYGVSVRERNCIVLGAGGSARAVVFALAQAGAHVHIYARRSEQATELVANLAPHAPAATLCAHDWTDYHSLPLEPALIVNTTPVGMHPHSDVSPWPVSIALPGTPFVYDLIYNPPLTQFMQEAQHAGLRTANGLGMLLRQGAEAFFIWTGRQPDIATMQAALGSTVP